MGSTTKPRVAAYPAIPPPVRRAPQFPTAVVRTLLAAEFVALSKWPCANPYCHQLIRRGHRTARSLAGEYFHATCVRAGFPDALIEPYDGVLLREIESVFASTSLAVASS